MNRSSRSPICVRIRGDPSTFCAYCYANFKCRSNYRGHAYYRSGPILKPFLWSLAMKRPIPVPVDPKGRKWECPDSWIFEAYPNLAAGLCDPWWDDGKPREVWTVKFSYQGGACNVAINDAAAKQVLFTTAASLEDAFEAIEAALESGRASWRKSKY